MAADARTFFVGWMGIVALIGCSSPSETTATSASGATGSEFGDTGAGSPWWNGFSDWKVGSPYVLKQSGSVRSITGTFSITGASTPSQAAIYLDSGGSPGSLVAGTVTPTISIPVGADQRVTFTLPSPVTLSPGTYWLAFGFASAGGNNVTLWTDPGGVVKWDHPPTMTNPFGAAAGSNSTVHLAAYATYVPAGDAGSPLDAGSDAPSLDGSLDAVGDADGSTDAGAVHCSRYVSTSGSDSNPGTLQLPWRTLEHAASQGGPGMTICARAGVYGESFFFRSSGASGQPLVLTSYPGERAILDGGNQQGFGIVVTGAYVTLSGLEIRNYRSTPTQKIYPGEGYGAGVWVGETHDCVLEGNVIHHIIGTPSTQPIGILVQNSPNVTLQRNTIYEVVGQGEAMGIEASGSDNTVVRNNLVFLADKEGIRMINGQITAVLVEGNVAIYNHFGIDTNSVWSSSAILETDNFCGFNWSTDMQLKHTTPLLVQHNTLVGGGQFGLDLHGGPPANGGFTDSAHCDDHNPTVIDNIFSLNLGGSAPYPGGSLGGPPWGGAWLMLDKAVFNATVDHNLYQGAPGVLAATTWTTAYQSYTLAQIRTNTNPATGDPLVSGGPYETHGLSGDPLFVNPAAGDFRLASGSPAIGAGSDGKNLGADPSVCSGVGSNQAFGLANVFAIKRLSTTLESASSQTSEGPAGGVLDGNDNTYWEVNPATDSVREIVVDLSSAQPVGFLTLPHYDDYYSTTWRYKTFQVFVDSGSGVWTRIPDAPEHPFVGFNYFGNGESWALPDGTVARRLKIKLIDGYGSTIRVPEIMLFNPVTF